jgi:hypothetical protein
MIFRTKVNQFADDEEADLMRQSLKGICRALRIWLLAFMPYPQITIALIPPNGELL